MPASRTRWGVVLLLISAGMIGAFQVGKAAIAVPALREDLGVSLYYASWIVGALGVLGAVVALPASLLLTLFPARATLIGGLCIAGAGSLAGALAPSGNLLIATRVLEGFGFLCIILSAPRLFRLVTAPSDNQTAFALWGCYMPVGAAIMMLMGPPLIQSFGWRGLWLFNGILPIAYAVVVGFLPLPGADVRDASRKNLGATIRAGFCNSRTFPRRCHVRDLYVSIFCACEPLSRAACRAAWPLDWHGRLDQRRGRARKRRRQSLRRRVAALRHPGLADRWDRLSGKRDVCFRYLFRRSSGHGGRTACRSKSRRHRPCTRVAIRGSTAGFIDGSPPRCNARIDHADWHRGTISWTLRSSPPLSSAMIGLDRPSFSWRR